jgi:hypothetical protein
LNVLTNLNCIVLKRLTLFLWHAININKARIRYWYFMFLSLTNVKISNKDFNWEKKKKKKDYCLIIVGVETTRFYIYHFASSVSNCVVFRLSSSCVPNVASFCWLSILFLLRLLSHSIYYHQMFGFQMFLKKQKRLIQQQCTKCM